MKNHKSYLWSMCAGFVVVLAEVVSTLISVDATDMAYLPS